MLELNIQILVPVLVFVSVIFIGASVVISRSEKRKLITERLSEELTLPQEVTEPQRKPGILRFFEVLGNLASHGSPSTSLWEQLIRAGYYHSTATAIYTGVKMVLFITGLVVSAIIIIPLGIDASVKITLIFLSGAILFFLPNVYVLAKLKKRHDEIRRHLPIMLDLLEICVSSGSGLDMAWNMVTDEIRHVSPVLANAMSLTSFEMHLGASRVEAMKNMGRRTGVDELSSLAAILIQTDRFGTSISDTLRIFANSIREERSHTAQEEAEKMAVKLLFPMILFIFPAILIVTAGPAFISIGKSLMYSQ